MVLNGKCVTVVASAGLHFRAFYLLTSAASHDLKETIDKDYCECGMPLDVHNCEGFKEAKSIKKLYILSLHSVQNEGVISIVRYGFCGD